MALGSFFSDWLNGPLLKRLAVVAASKPSCLTSCGALLPAQGLGGALLPLLVVGVPARTAFASTLNSLRCKNTIPGRIDIATVGDASPIKTDNFSESLNLWEAAPDRADFAWIGS